MQPQQHWKTDKDQTNAYAWRSKSCHRAATMRTYKRRWRRSSGFMQSKRSLREGPLVMVVLSLLDCFLGGRRFHIAIPRAHMPWAQHRKIYWLRLRILHSQPRFTNSQIYTCCKCCRGVREKVYTGAHVPPPTLPGQWGLLTSCIYRFPNPTTRFTNCVNL